MAQIAPPGVAAHAADPPGLPLVVHLGFAGSRTLLDTAANPGVNPEAFESAVEPKLRARLLALREELGLGPRHFFCGISQVAIGADSVFTRACAELAWPQRVFLPEPRSDFLTATSSAGIPDFTPAQQATARALLASPHIVQERVVSEAQDRSDRFTDVNLELVRVSDVIVCLVRGTAAVTATAGGTRALIDDAIKRGRPVLEIRLGVDNGAPSFAEVWRCRDGFRVPE